MRLRSFIRAILAVLCFSPLVVMGAKPTFLVTLASAKAPATISPGETVQVSYRVTNNTTYTLNGNGLSQIPAGLKQIGGANSCGSPFNLAVGGSCILYLEIIADEMRVAIHGGPLVCNTLAHPIYCSRPSEGNEINIVKTNGPTPPVNQVTLNVTPTTLDFAVNSTGSVTVTNQSTTIAAENITARPPTGSAISVTQNTCTPSLAAGQQCTITFTATGEEVNAQVKISGINTDTKTVSVSANIAFISVNTSSGILDSDGNTHVVFTVTNNSNSTGSAINIQGIPSTVNPTWVDVTVTPDAGCSSLAPGDSCTISMSSGTSPTGTPNAVGYLTLSGTNTNTIRPLVAFRFQGGLVLEVDENTPSPGNTTSLIIAETDASTNSGQDWGGAGIAVGVANGSTTPCDGSSDGACNTAAIITALGTTPDSSAAVVCTDFEIDSAGNSPCVIGNTCYNDWYLPAICRLNNYSGAVNCPALNNIYNNLFAVGFLTNLATNLYWSSTEVIGAGATFAWATNFASNGQLNLEDKTTAVGVRCSRTAIS